MSTHSYWLRIKLLFAVAVLTVLEIGPIPLFGLLLIWVIVFRPRWFKALLDRIYET
ncbi:MULTISPECIES: hypothetical protein [Methylomonas]|uniref:hypothetical protein n=1 Tax=Methylomonas TaxID=416 RepID=UPI000A90AA36|nr:MULTISPECIES: hypothetical protein [Methylomonas]